MRGWMLSGRSRFAARQLHHEGRTPAVGGFDPDGSPVRFDDAASDPESEAEPAVAAAGDGPLESVEDALLIARRDADAVIAHGQLDRAGGGPDAELDRLVGAVFHRVGKQVADHLLDPLPVPEAAAIAVALHGDLESGPPRLVVPGRGHFADQ